MQALLCHQHGEPEQVLSIAHCDSPLIEKADDVIIKVDYASISHAVGLMIQGKYQRKPPLPFSPGTEAVGTVEAIGTEVKHVKVGQRVLFISDWGAYAQFIKLPKYTVYPIPDDIDSLTALPLAISYGTAYMALVERVQIKPHHTLCVLGAGSGVGLAAVEIAKTIGCQVIACASSAEKCAVAKQAGADHTVTIDEQYIQHIKALTNGRGADIIFDPVGGDLFIQSLRASAQNGHLISIGFASGHIPAAPMNLALVKNLSLHGFFYGQYLGWTPKDQRQVYENQMHQMMDTLFRWTNTQHLKPFISKVYALDQIPDALNDLNNRRVKGKIAVKINH